MLRSILDPRLHGVQFRSNFRHFLIEEVGELVGKDEA
jgi:hypothetical protein